MCICIYIHNLPINPNICAASSFLGDTLTLREDRHRRSYMKGPRELQEGSWKFVEFNVSSKSIHFLLEGFPNRVNKDDKDYVTM